MTADPTQAQAEGEELRPFVSACCEGERCTCGQPAIRKVAEVIFHDDPHPHRHELTSYVCADCFIQVMGARTGLEALTRRAPSAAEGSGGRTSGDVANAYYEGAMAAIDRNWWDGAADFFALVGQDYAAGKPLPSTMPKRRPPAAEGGLVEALEAIKVKGTRTDSVRIGDAYDPNGWQEITEVSEEAEIAIAALAAHARQGRAAGDESAPAQAGGGGG